MKYLRIFKRTEEDAFWERQRRIAYSTPGSILEAYHTFLISENIPVSSDEDLIRKHLRGRVDLQEGILRFYKNAQLENERIAILEDIYAIDKSSPLVVQLALEAFHSSVRPANLWDYGELLYRINNFQHLEQYILLAENEALGDARQMIVLLLGKSKQKNVIPTLIRLLEDGSVCGHALEALSNFKGDEVRQIMERFRFHKSEWIREIAIKYLKKHRSL